MPKAAHYSAATKRLNAELAARGHHQSCSTLESWASDGFVPRPVRVSAGRKGSTSAYPAGAVEQYAAVADVMQRGRDRRMSVLVLIGRGGLPTTSTAFRRALRYLFEGAPVCDQDALTLAEGAYADAQTDRLFRRLASFMSKNAAAAGLTDPVTGQPVPTESVVESAFVNGLASMVGRQFPSDQAISELAAAYGFLEPGVSDEERAEREHYIEAFYEDVMNFDTLRATAELVSPDQLQGAVREFLGDEDLSGLELLEVLPASWREVMTVVFGLAVVTSENLGGSRWFERAISGCTT